MRQSKLFGKTVHNTPKEITIASHKLLYQAGFIRESRAGRYYLLPLAKKVLNKMIDLIRGFMNNSGAQELITPVLHPIELWEETNRTDQTGFELMRIKDRRQAEFALGGTAEEMIIDLVRQFTISYKDLPFNIYQFSTKFRDELRARGGLLRLREFTMKDAYSFHTDEENFKHEYDKMAATYTTIYNALGIETAMVAADNGYIGGEYCHEFIVDCEVGESRYFVTQDGSYCFHEDIAPFIKEEKNKNEPELPLQEVTAKRGPTMEDGVALHKKPLWQQIKNVLYKDNHERFILACIRGDYEVNETKLIKILNNFNKDLLVSELNAATDQEIITKIKSIPGFLSPINIKKSLTKDTPLLIVGDDSLRTIKNAYSGANSKNKDYFNINIARDFQVDIEADIAKAKEGYLAPDNNQPLIAKKGIEVGNIFQLGYHYSSKMNNAQFTDKDGQLKNYYMGCYGIGIERTLATIVEKHHDSCGIIWPENIAPYKVHLLSLGEKTMIKTACEKLYESLLKNNIEVLYDDREESPGVKLKDSDLIGIPYRLIISEKTLAADSVELKKRDETTPELIKLEAILQKLLS